MLNEQFISSNISIIIAIVLIDYALKATALWKSARNNSKIWFLLLLIINSVGILPLFYIFYFSKKDKSETE